MSLCPLWHTAVLDEGRKGDRRWCQTRQKFFIKQEQGHIKRDEAAASMPAAASALWMDDNMKMTGPSKGVKFWECLIINALVIFFLKWVRDFKAKNRFLLPLKNLYFFILIFMLRICVHGKFIFTLWYDKVIICNFFHCLQGTLCVVWGLSMLLYYNNKHSSELFHCVAHGQMDTLDAYLYFLWCFSGCPLFFLLNSKVLLTFNNSIRKSQAVRAHLCHVNI